MSMFGWSGGDVANGLALAWYIWSKGFKQENAASVQYARFKDGVSDIRENLSKLQETLENTQQIRGLGQAQSPEDRAGTQPVVGDFFSTLKECDAFLKENERLRARSNAIQNLKWYLQQRDRQIADFYQRLQFHSEKVRLVNDCVMLHLVQNAAANTDDLVFYQEQGWVPASLFVPEHDHRVANELAQKFKSHELDNAPLEFETGIRLEQGFDALIRLWSQCSGVLGPEPETYVLFLRTRWFLDTIKRTESYSKAEAGNYYKRAIKQIEKEIFLKSCESGKVIPCSDVDALIALPASAFCVWPPPADGANEGRRNRLMAGAEEELIACINLVKQFRAFDEHVAIFKMSDGIFRVQPFQTQVADRSEPILGEELLIDPRQHLFIPLYALPDSVQEGWEIRLIGWGGSKTYKFDSWLNLKIFQTALIGYEVPHDQQHIKCEFATAGLDCDARIQLWQEPEPAPPLEQSAADDNMAASGADALQRRPSSSRTWKSVPQQLNKRFTNTTVRLPAVAIFTKLPGRRKTLRPAVIFLELQEGVLVRKSECLCRTSPGTCLDLVLKARGSEKLSVTVLIADGESRDGIHSDKLNLFPFSLPHGKRFDSLTRYETKHLMLSFRDTQAQKGSIIPGILNKEEFQAELHWHILLRISQTGERVDNKKDLHYHQNELMNPKRKDSRTASFASSSTRHSSSSSLPLRPRLASVPQVEMPDSGSQFAVRFGSFSAL